MCKYIFKHRGYIHEPICKYFRVLTYLPIYLTFASPEVPSTSQDRFENEPTPVREDENEQSPTSNDDHNTPSQFRNLQFRPKVRARGRPKRPQRQLCSFNKTAADREAGKGSRRGRKQNLNVGTVTTASKRRRHSVTDDDDDDRTFHGCPTCASPIRSGETGVTNTDCCLTLIHIACLSEVDHCPDCNA